MPPPREVRLFVASPSDVQFERARLDKVVKRMNTAFAPAARFACYRWEENFYTAGPSYQDQIPEPADYDVVIAIFGSRLGSELPETFPRRRPDGGVYASGTAYELLSSLAAADQRSKPDVYVFRKSVDPVFGLSQKSEYEKAHFEKQRLDAFFDQWFGAPGGVSLRPFHMFAKPDDFESQVETLLRQWAEKKLRIEPGSQIGRDVSPFRGLRAFDARQSSLYFGRDRKVGRALEEWLRAAKQERGRPFLLVVGPSGAGKSSLVRAGLAPRLTAAGNVPEVDQWRIAVMRPAGAATAFAALAEALYFDPPSDAVEDDPSGFGRALPELKASPYRAAADLVELLQAAPISATATILAALDAIGERERLGGGFDRRVRVDLLLLVDQLEEIFDGGAEPQRAPFGRLLTALTDSKRVWIAATLRADLYGRMLDPKLPFLALKDSGGAYDLASPGEAELAEILRMSAAAAGLAYEADPGSGEMLDDRLLRDAKGSDDTLPLLQFTLERLFQQRQAGGTADSPKTLLTYAAYNELRGLDGAIDQVAEAALSDPQGGLTSADIEAALPRLLRGLAAQVSGDRAATAGQAGLTMRSQLLDEAERDESSRKLVEVLVRARLLVVESTPPSEGNKPLAYVRLAHERVLTSWRRAAKIVDDEKTYFRVRAGVEQQYRRWLEGNRDRDLLLPAGTPLHEAELLAHVYGGELASAARKQDDPPPSALAQDGDRPIPSMLDYIAISGRRARWRQRVTAAAVLVVFAFAVLATAFGLVAVSAERQAASNYQAAKYAADDLVASIARDLRKQKDISSGALDIAFSAVEKLLTRIQDAVARQDWAVTRELNSALAAVESRFMGAPAPVGEESAIELSRATLLYEFAETYHQSANDLAKAHDKAQQSLDLRTRVRDSGDSSPDLAVAIAMTQMELGDLERLTIDARKSNSLAQASIAAFATVRKRFETALSLLAPLAPQFPRHLDWARDYSKLLTRLGDLEMKAPDREAAIRRYGQAHAVTIQVLHDAPDDPDSVNELAWSYRKLGEVQPDAAAALRIFGDEVCARRRAVALRPNDVLWAQGLGHSLIKLGGSRLRAVPPDVPGARDAFDEALRVRLDILAKDSSKLGRFDDLAEALEQLAGAYRSQDDADAAKAFDSASADVERNAGDLFGKLPPDEPARSQAQQRKEQLGKREPIAMIESAKQRVIYELQSFEASRLDNVKREAEGCWERLRQSVAAARPPGDASN